MTFTAIVLRDDQVQEFLTKTGIADFELGGSDWQQLRIQLPDLSLREKLRLDQVIFTKNGKHKPVVVQTAMGLKFAPDVVDSREMIDNYIKFYRYYPHYYRVTF